MTRLRLDLHAAHFISPRLLACLLLASVPVAQGCAETRPLIAEPTRPIERTRSSQKAPVAVEWVEVHVTLHADGTWKRVFRHRYRILDRSAVDSWGATQARYSPWFTKKPRFDVRVINTDAQGKEQVFTLDQALLTEEPAYPQAPEIYGDARVLRAPIPKVDVGSVVDETIITESHRTFLHPAYLHRAYFDTTVPVAKARLIVDAPKDMPVKFQVFDAVVRRSEKQVGDRVVTSFEGGPYEGLESLEGSLPPDVIRWPSVAVTTGQSWEELAKTYDEVVEQALSGIDVGSALRGIIEPKDAPRTKMTKILQWVKDRVRYVGVEFGDAAVVPQPPDKTLSRGFGDCKDQATLLVGLLRAAGFEAQVALLSAGMGEDLAPTLPALNVFNHAIVHVSEPEELYIDPTGDFFVIGNLPTSDQGRHALIAGGKRSGLAKTPLSAADGNTYSETRFVQLAQVGPARVREVSRGTGAFDAELREAFSSAPDRLAENLKQYVEQTYGAKEVMGIKHTNALDLAAPFSGELVAPEADTGRTELLEAWANLPEQLLFRWLPEGLLEEEARKQPLFVANPYSATLVWEIEPPSAFVRSKVPGTVTLDFGVGRLSRNSEAHPDGSVTVRSTFTLDHSRLTPKEVMAFREAYGQWGASTVPQVSYRHKAWDLSQRGKVADAVAWLRQELSNSKEPARSHLRMSYVLRPYLEATALESARRAVQLAPDDVAVWEQFAAVVTDNVSREDLGAGYSRSEALDAYEKVYTLDSSKTYAKLRQALALEHPVVGERYESDKADLLRAVGLYDSIEAKELREFDDGAFRWNALFALFWAGEHDRLQSRLDSLPLGDKPKGLVVLNTAAMRGAAAALATADELGLGTDDRNSILQDASAVLVRNGDYQGAALLLEAIRIEGEEARALKTRAIMLKGLKATPANPPENTPAQFGTKLFTLGMLREESDTGFALAYLAKGAKAKAAESQLKEAVDALRREIPKKLTRQVMLDLTAHGSKSVVDGSDRLGYRVKLSFDYGSAVVTDLYLLKENGRFKLRALSGYLGEIGAGAWEALAAGNTERAKQWLDWAREAYQAGDAEDPLRVGPFARLWNDGKGDLKGAAATLAAASDLASEVIPYLEQRAAQASTSEERQIFLHALSFAYYRTSAEKQRAGNAQTLYGLLPDSKIARSILLGALWDSEQFPEYRRLVQQSLDGAKSSREQLELRERLAGVASRQGKLDEARQRRLDILKRYPDAWGQYNSLAWLGLFTGATDEHVKFALRALEAGRNAARLHTLACLYAQLGRIDEAGKTLAELRALRPKRELLPHDRYIVGRIAEHLGFKKVAIEAYGLVERPKGTDPTSTYALAQGRLAKLQSPNLTQFFDPDSLWAVTAPF